MQARISTQAQVRTRIQHASRALVDIGNNKVMFEHADGVYRYIYQRSTATREGRLMVRISRERMEAFRTSRFGSAVEDVVDIFSQGNGWYEVTSQDFENYESKTASRHDGLKLWLNVFNKFFTQHVTVEMPSRVVLKTKAQIAASKGFVARIEAPIEVSQTTIQALSAKFASVHTKNRAIH